MSNPFPDAAAMLAPVAAAIVRPPVFCTPDVPLAKVLGVMHDARIGCMPVVDARTVPVGIFTTADVLECAAPPQTPMDTAIGNLMTRKPVTLAESATLTEAALAMARHGIRHILVTRDGRLSGVLSQRDLFGLQRLDGAAR